MKKNSTSSERKSKPAKLTKRELSKGSKSERLTIGLDLGDRMSHYCVLNEQGEVVVRDKVATTKGI
jgi:hypothetical protein